MKNMTLLFLCILGFISVSNGQTEAGWKPQLNEVKFVAQTGAESVLGVDPGFRYANLSHDRRDYRMFYHRNIIKNKNIRIVDQKSGLEIARGRGTFFWGSGRIEFIDGEIIRLKRKNDPNGYTIIGPYGELFKVENQAMGKVKTYGEKDFLAQAFFFFEWIRITQNPPQDVVIIYTASNSN
jgi:hypothetical protein